MTEDDKIRLVCYVMGFASGEWTDGPDEYGFNWKTHYNQAQAVMAFLAENPELLTDLRSFSDIMDRQRRHSSWLQTDIRGRPLSG